MFAYRPNYIPNRIYIVGCGGTGSRVVPLVAQFIKTCHWVQDPEIHIIDDDEVEEKNLVRQNFIASDVGKKKAEVLANRYSKAFDVNIFPHTFRVDQKLWSQLGKADSEVKFMSEHVKNTLIIMCVDTPAARKDIIETFLKAGVSSNTLLIDSGNEDEYGQVCISSMSYPRFNSSSMMKYLKELPNHVPDEVFLNDIPINWDYYLNMKSESKLSCADLDQTMAINILMATNIFAMVQQLYFAKPFYAHRINISLAHGASPEYLTTNYLVKLLEQSEGLNKNSNGSFFLPQYYLDDAIYSYYNTWKVQKKQLDKLEAKAKAEAAKLEKKAKEDWFLEQLVARGIKTVEELNNEKQAELDKAEAEAKAIADMKVDNADFTVAYEVSSTINIDPGNLASNGTSKMPYVSIRVA